MRIVLKGGRAIDVPDSFARRMIEQGQAAAAPAPQPKPAKPKARRKAEVIKHEPEGEDRS